MRYGWIIAICLGWLLAGCQAEKEEAPTPPPPAASAPAAAPVPAEPAKAGPPAAPPARPVSIIMQLDRPKTELDAAKLEAAGLANSTFVKEAAGFGFTVEAGGVTRPWVSRLFRTSQRWEGGAA